MLVLVQILTTDILFPNKIIQKKEVKVSINNYSQV